MQHTFLLFAGKFVHTPPKSSIDFNAKTAVFEPENGERYFSGLLVRVNTDNDKLVLLPIIPLHSRLEHEPGQKERPLFDEEGTLIGWGDPYRDSWDYVFEIFDSRSKIITHEAIAQRFQDSVFFNRQEHDILHDKIHIPFGEKYKLIDRDSALKFVNEVLSTAQQKTCNLAFSIGDPDEKEIPPLSISVSLIKDSNDLRARPELVISNSFFGEGADNTLYSYTIAERTYNILIERLRKNQKFVQSLYPENLENVVYQIIREGAFGEVRIRVPINTHRPDILFNEVVRELAHISKNPPIKPLNHHVETAINAGTLVDRDREISSSPPRE